MLVNKSFKVRDILDMAVDPFANNEQSSLFRGWLGLIDLILLADFFVDELDKKFLAKPDLVINVIKDIAIFLQKFFERIISNQLGDADRIPVTLLEFFLHRDDSSHSMMTILGIESYRWIVFAVHWLTLYFNY
jgi:hypothetical protein